MVFTGDWNGGERALQHPAACRNSTSLGIGTHRTDERRGASLATKRNIVSRDNMDEFVMERPEKTLRWRSRLPSDPAVLRTRGCTSRAALQAVGYRAERCGAVIRLDHDFAFPDRAGQIARFSLELASRSRLAAAERRSVALHRRPARARPKLRADDSTATTRAPDRPAILDERRPRRGCARGRAPCLGAFVVGILAFFVRERVARPLRCRVSTAGVDSDVDRTADPHAPGGSRSALPGMKRIGARRRSCALIARMTGEGKLESEAAAKTR